MKKMRTVYTIAFLLLLFFGALTKTQAMANYPQTEKVPRLVQALKDEGAHVKQWSLYAREESSASTTKDFYEKVNTLEGTFDTFRWSRVTKTENQHLEVMGTRKIRGLDGTETIRIFAYPRKDGIVTYIIYELNGSSWSQKSWTDFSTTLKSRLDVLFQQNGKIFACATGIFSDKMDIVISKKTNEILSRFHAEGIEQVEEKTFESVSAYTDEWNDSITTNGRKMNLQVGLRSITEGTTVTIGTPIITTEY